MKYAQLREFDTTNGPGVRVSLFVSGCTLHCKGCFNPESWDFNAGDDFTNETIEKIIDLINRPYMSGLSVLGGDPFEKENIDTSTMESEMQLSLLSALARTRGLSRKDHLGLDRS